MMSFEPTISFAKQKDSKDPLAKFKSEFHFPEHQNQPVIYFCGNSLGLQPKRTAEAVAVELDTWKNHAIGGFYKGAHPWLYYQEYLRTPLGKIVGAKESEVSVMNSLTVNLHLLMLSFYRPNAKRYKVMMEAGAFPSDQYAVETQVKHYGFDPADAIIELHPQPGTKILDTQDILQTIDEHKNELALILLGGINYYTGQYFDIPTITKFAKERGITVGWDLAHVVGNIPLQLHNWEVDFAVWCSYKYLNGGPGAVGGYFIHEQHVQNPAINRLAGWWGNDENIRFKMEKRFVPKTTASGWNVSTAQVLNTVALKASLEIFDAADIHQLRTKSIDLTNYLEFLLNQLKNLDFEIISPQNSAERGAQLSLYFKENGKAIQEKMLENGIVVDYREPGVIRVAPAPLYCSYSDVYKFYEILQNNFN